MDMYETHAPIIPTAPSAATIAAPTTILPANPHLLAAASMSKVFR